MSKDKKTSSSADSYSSGWGGYSSYYRKRKSKSDWAGISLGDAFRPNLDYYERLPAQNLFYARVSQLQKAVHKLASAEDVSGSDFLVKPQLSPLYTQYPAVAAAYAAIGLTGFLEYESLFSDKILTLQFGNYLIDSASESEETPLSQSGVLLVKIIEKAVRIRILLQELSAYPAFSPLEVHRLFMSTQQDLRFRTMIDVVFNAVLYGEILPDFRNIELHPTTRTMLELISETSKPYIEGLSRTPPGLLVEFGMQWCRDLVKVLAPRVSEPKQADATKMELLEAGLPDPANPANLIDESSDDPQEETELPALNRLQPPLLIDPDSIVEQMTLTMINNLLPDDSGAKPSEQQARESLLMKFIAALRSAGIQQLPWEDLRSDIIERMLHFKIFDAGLMEGSPTDGRQIDVTLKEGKTFAGEIYDRPVPLSDDAAACRLLLEEARPVTEALIRSLYPNVEKLPETDRFRTSGALDPARLAMMDFSSAVFKRYRMREKADRRGRPVLAIACDGSGSLNSDQMRMLKLLTAAWLKSTARSEIQVLAGLYHSGEVRPGMAGPLVQWIFHPQKTPTLYRQDAVRALPELPNSGTGMQSDAVSIAYIMKEARLMARGRMVYLILLTDCAWNRSFPSSMSGAEEVRSLFENLYMEAKGKLHTTMVALGTQKETGLENIVDKIIPVPPNELNNAAAVAKKIGHYVASCIRERTRLISKTERRN
jgi:hypothetical protein